MGRDTGSKCGSAIPAGNLVLYKREVVPIRRSGLGYWSRPRRISDQSSRLTSNSPPKLGKLVWLLAEGKVGPVD